MIRGLSRPFRKFGLGVNYFQVSLDCMDERYSNALAILQDALARCRAEDMRTPEVWAAIDFLEARANPKWPFKQFREALERTASKDWGN